MTERFANVRLGSILRHRKEFFTLDDTVRYKRVRVQLHNQGIVLRDVVEGAELRTKKQQLVKVGDFLVAEIDAKVGGFGIVPPELDGAIVSSHYFLYEIDETNCLRGWLDAFIRSGGLEDQVKARGTTNYAAIRPEHVFDFEIPLPPIAEQRRLVARIEELAAKIELAHGLRTGSTIEAERISISARYQVFSQLQRRFVSVPLDSVADSRLGKMLSAHAKTGRYPTPYLRNANIQWDKLDLSSIYEMDFDEDEKKEFELQTGDILVCEGGDIGKAAIWNNEIRGCCYQKALHRVRADSTRLIPRFMLYHLFWAAEQGHFSELKTQTTIPHLTGVKLKAYPVYVPSLSEQEKVVSYLDKLREKAGDLRRFQAETAVELDALLSSILDRAFKGEL